MLCIIGIVNELQKSKLQTGSGSRQSCRALSNSSACLPAWLGSVMFVLLFVFAVRVVSNVNLKSFSIFFTFVSLARFADFYLQLKEFVVCIDVCRM